MKTSVNYDGEVIEYTINRGKRKTIGISIKPEGDVYVNAPYRVNDEYVKSVILKKGEWIRKKLIDIKTKCPQPKKYLTGNTFSILGRDYILEINNDAGRKKAYTEFKDGLLKVNIPKEADGEGQQDTIKNTLEKWLKEFAKIAINERLNHYSSIMGVTPGKVYFKSQKTIWGSCTRDNNININWRIIMAPIEIVDYLVVHELAHIKVKNHSKIFWNAVEAVLPDHKIRRKWLKDNGNKLII